MEAGSSSADAEVAAEGAWNARMTPRLRREVRIWNDVRDVFTFNQWAIENSCMASRKPQSESHRRVHAEQHRGQFTLSALPADVWTPELGLIFGPSSDDIPASLPAKMAEQFESPELAELVGSTLTEFSRSSNELDARRIRTAFPPPPPRQISSGPFSATPISPAFPPQPPPRKSRAPSHPAEATHGQQPEAWSRRRRIFALDPARGSGDNEMPITNILEALETDSRPATTPTTASSLAPTGRTEGEESPASPTSAAFPSYPMPIRRLSIQSASHDTRPEAARQGALAPSRSDQLRARTRRYSKLLVDHEHLIDARESRRAHLGELMLPPRSPAQPTRATSAPGLGIFGRRARRRPSAERSSGDAAATSGAEQVDFWTSLSGYLDPTITEEQRTRIKLVLSKLVRDWREARQHPDRGVKSAQMQWLTREMHPEAYSKTEDLAFGV